MNKAILIGNLARDPETMTTSSGIMKCNFTVAVQRRFANAQGVREADFIPVVCWRQTAELCSRYLSKGRKVAVEGSIQVRSYDAQDGTKRYITEVVADSVEFLGSRDDGQRSGGGYSAPAAPAPAPRQAAPAGDFMEVDDDELPF
ncbi:MAG: single-stranded DNA-binding protein [Clostridia bacterium]|nr:single-stranded DNA-binding protein [Clostridia bacterium]